MHEPQNLKKRGPSTPEGKRRVSTNAIKHGLYAQSRQAMEKLAEETQADFQNILSRMNQHYRPIDPVEEMLVERIARCVWRLQRAKEMESKMVERNPAAGMPDAGMEKILKQERLVDIHLHRAIFALAKARECRALSD